MVKLAAALHDLALALMARISKRTPKVPFIVMGDLNVQEDNVVTRYFKGDAKIAQLKSRVVELKRQNVELRQRLRKRNERLASVLKQKTDSAS